MGAGCWVRGPCLYTGNRKPWISFVNYAVFAEFVHAVSVWNMLDPFFMLLMCDEWKTVDALALWLTFHISLVEAYKDTSVFLGFTWRRRA